MSLGYGLENRNESFFVSTRKPNQSGKQTRRSKRINQNYFERNTANTVLYASFDQLKKTNKATGHYQLPFDMIQEPRWTILSSIEHHTRTSERHALRKQFHLIAKESRGRKTKRLVDLAQRLLLAKPIAWLSYKDRDRWVACLRNKQFIQAEVTEIRKRKQQLLSSIKTRETQLFWNLTACQKQESRKPWEH